MYTRVFDDLKQCEIWVDYPERSTYKTTEDYIQTINKYKELKYKISVFVGGSRPLLPTVMALLEIQ